MNKNSITSFDFRDRIIIDKSKINGKINVGDYIKVDENNNNFPNKWIITNKENATNIILCEDADNDGTKVIIQSINGSIKVKHDNMDDKNINDFIPDNKDMRKSGILVYKDLKNQIYLIESNIYKYRLYYFLSEEYKLNYFLSFKLLDNDNYLRKFDLTKLKIYESFINIIKKYPKILSKYNKETYLLHGSTSPSLLLFKNDDGIKPQNWFKNKKYNSISGEKLRQSTISKKYVSTVPLSESFYFTALQYSGIDKVNPFLKTNNLYYDKLSFYFKYNNKSSKKSTNTTFLTNYTTPNKSFITDAFSVLYCLNIDNIDEKKIKRCYSDVPGEVIIEDGFSMYNISSIIVPENKLEQVKEYITVQKLNNYKIDLKSFEDVFKQKMKKN